MARIVEVEAWTAASGGATANLNWLVTDQLGTPRMIFDKTGALATVKRHDYLPFGEEIFAGTGGRTTTIGYSAADNVRQKFTSKELDNETGLDYFLARYYSPAQGRFTSPDEFSGGPDELYEFANDAAENPTFYADLTNPLSLNKYQYTYDNPTNLTDDDGHCLPICAAAAAAAAVYILLSPETIHAPTPNDTLPRESSPPSGVQIVNLGAAEALGGPILSKTVGRISRTVSRIAGKTSVRLADESVGAEIEAGVGGTTARSESGLARSATTKATAKKAAKEAFKREAGDHPRKIIRDLRQGGTGRIKGVGAGKASYRPKGQGRYSVTPQSGKAKMTEHFP